MGTPTPYQRFYAWALDRYNAPYERFMAERKGALFADLSGTVLEIGPGTGANLRHLPPSVQWLGVEPNPAMHGYLHAEAARQGRAVEVRQGSAEALPWPDGAVDAVLSTLVLCSVGDLAGTLAEIQRVLRPGGRFLFVEHVIAAPGTARRGVQRLLSPLWRRAADGCHPDRDTGAALHGAGFAEVHFERFEAPLPVVRPHIAGFARKGGGATGRR
jgi:SAM-dependent methyltransferase